MAGRKRAASTRSTRSRAGGDEELQPSPATVARRNEPQPQPTEPSLVTEEQRSTITNISVPSMFEKLEGASTYLDWRFAMESHLFNCDLWDYVEGSRVDERQSKRSRGAIISGIKSNLFSSIREATSEKEIWDRLEKLYQPRGLFREVALLEELTTVRYADCKDMDEYINRKVTAAQKLKAIDSEVKDRLLAGLILRKLPEEFSPLVQSISTHDGVTTEFVKERLLSEAARLDAQKRESALACTKVTYRSNARRGVPEPAGEFRFRGTCYKCGKPGHKRTECTSGEEYSRVAVVVGGEDTKGPEAIAPMSEQFERVLKCSWRRISEDWFIDSGASAHMTGRKDLFHSLNGHRRGRKVVTANDEVLRCEGSGDVSIVLGVDGARRCVRLWEVLYVPGLTVSLVSVKQLTRSGFSVLFKGDRGEVRDTSGDLCAVATSAGGGLYRVGLDVLMAAEVPVTPGASPGTRLGTRSAVNGQRTCPGDRPGSGWKEDLGVNRGAFLEMRPVQAFPAREHSGVCPGVRTGIGVRAAWGLPQGPFTRPRDAVRGLSRDGYSL